VRHRWARKRHVIFDWNGTLIDDIDLAVRAANECCVAYGVRPINREIYRAHFCFPIQDFYTALGFDFEHLKFADLVRTYLRTFDAEVADCSLHEGVESLLEELRCDGHVLSILSACHQPALLEAVRRKGLVGIFTHVVGIEDQHAAGKLQRASSLQALSGVSAAETVYIGDTSHDADIALASGWDATLVSCGHQHVSRFSGYPFEVLDSPRELLARGRAAATHPPGVTPLEGP
jgi:phosphoglycolate phosphatase